MAMDNSVGITEGKGVKEDLKNNGKNTRKISLGWCGLHAGLRTKGSPGRFPVRAHGWAEDLVSSWERARGNQLVSLSYIDVPIPLFLPPFPSKNK